VLWPAGAALVVLALLWAAQDAHPVARPIAERFAVLTVALAVVAALAMAAARAHPEPAATELDPVRLVLPEPATLPSELRRVADTFERSAGVGARRGQDVGGRAQAQRLGRERLAARGLHVDEPGHAEAIRALTGPDLWVLVATPVDRPVRHVDLDAALDHLEAL